ncbi:MAG: SURF1 family protein [Proteobacteria bacterium]|nr:SURF1 family protein [Pseudomonadota bacterium]
MSRPFTFFALLLIFVLLGLGTWQLQRKAQKEALLTTMAHNQLKPTYNINSDTHLESFTPAYAKGHFLKEKTIFLQSKVHKGKNGLYVLGVFQTEGGQFLLVQRGWSLTEVHEVPLGHLTLHGIVRTPTPPNYFQPPNAAPIYFWIDLKALSQDLNLPLLPYYLVSTTSYSPQIDHVNLLPQITNNHLSYAIIWYLLAFLFGTMLLWSRKYYFKKET